ncbi:MAG: SUF system NifU family Fe-S cluster assembly protein [Ruminococcus sp.]|nr:SUF system NifU family Fe-S cluster assembly protein [Ruminococcus sp.]MBR2303727.1 SUF system NifU family Fe-S cluster assembly protein [Ruminococcus sp.]
MADNFYGEVLTDHNLHPLHKHGLSCATCSHRGINPSCGDDITLELDIRDGVIKGGSFTGSGCAVSQASADIMLELIIGKTVEEAKHYQELFMKMIGGEINDDELEELEEAGALQSVAKMPARVKCAVLSWRTLDAML